MEPNDNIQREGCFVNARNHVVDVAMDSGEINGITLRQWYAGLAMQGLLSGDSHPDVDPMTILDDIPKRAKWAYEIADAMIAEDRK